MNLGRVGVWWSGSWKPTDPSGDPATALEAFGYGAFWSSGGFKPGLSTHFERLLASTRRAVVASGVVNIWTAPPKELSAATAELGTRYPGRFLLGLGVSHAPVVEIYERPYAHMTSYLDALDSLGAPVAKDRRVLAALGPRMLELAGSRAAGAHPYLVPVEHTSRARKLLGAGPLLAPELTVVIEPDGRKARELARSFTTYYLTLPNYVSNLRSLGFGDNDLSGGGSDRLIDAVVAHGDLGTVAARVQEHHDAGADHVAIQILSAQESLPLSQYRALAAVVLPA